MYQILVVDDSVLDVDCITFLIKKYELPLEVATAVNGQDALELFRKPENHYDILFTDIRMPFLDGLGLSKEVRKLSPNTRIIIFSGFNDFEYAKTAITIGVEDYLMKPVIPDEFVSVMTRVINGVEETNRQIRTRRSETKLLKNHMLWLAVNGKSSMLADSAPFFKDRYTGLMLVECDNEFFSLEELPDKTGYIKENLQKADTAFVSFENVTFAYEEQNVIDNLSFEVKEGEQVTLSGRTGAGKSTIFKLLLGLYEPKTGSVQIQGKPAKDIPDTEKRHLFGYVEQSFHMVPGTVKEQITLYDPSITMEDVRAAAKMTGLDDTIMSLEHGYDTPCSDGIFSQGQWQLLSIARAAAAKPKLLLLDEITANLDAQTEKEVLQALKRVSENRTVISISHRVNATTGRVIEI